MADTKELNIRLAHAGMPQGEYGSRLLDHMNTGEHERLATWGFESLPKTLFSKDIESNTAGPRILDVGCGGGANLMRLHDRYGGTVIGIDHSPVSVNKSIETCKPLIEKGLCEVREGDVSSLPYDADTFSLVTAFETVYFWPDMQTSISEIFRVLTHDGFFLICNEAGGGGDLPDWADLTCIYNSAELESVLRWAGFLSIESRMEANGWLCVLGRKP